MRQHGPQHLLRQAVLVAFVATLALHGAACRDLVGEGASHGRGLKQTTATSATVVSEGVTYVLYKSPVTLDWRTAYNKCRTTKYTSGKSKLNMVLAKIPSQATQDAINTAATNLGLLTGQQAFAGAYWIGLNDITTEGTYKWANDGSIQPSTVNTFNGWGLNEPSIGGDGDCVFVDGKWVDAPCLDKYSGYLCQVLPKGRAAPLPPMPGGASVVSTVTGDNGLYSGINNGISWVPANEFCKAGGATLVKISSAAQNTWVRNTFFPTKQLWIGAIRVGSDALYTSGQWPWYWTSDNTMFWNRGAVTGTNGVTVYSNWFPNEPTGGYDTNTGNPEKYAHMWDTTSASGTNLGKWNDHAEFVTDTGFAFVCWVPFY